MLVMLDIITMLTSTACLVAAIRKLRAGSRYVFFILFYLVAVLPLILDYVIGVPEYASWQAGSKNYGFIISYNDSMTRALYDIFLLVFQFVLLIFGKNKQAHDGTSHVMTLTERSYKRLVVLLAAASILPPLLVLVTPLPKEILFDWGWRDAGLYGVEGSKYYFSIEKLSYIGFAASILLLFRHGFDGKGWRFTHLIWLAPACMNICIEAKRSIIFFAAVIVLCLLVEYVPKKKLKGVIFLAIVSMVMLVMFSINVKMKFRGYAGADVLYATLRIDYFRDDRVKMLIYSLLNPDRIHVLSFPLESYIMQIGYIFPLDFLGVPRLGYNTYFTSALIQQPLSLGLNYMTTSMLDEALANFGYLGYLVAPLIAAFLAREADKHDVILKTLITSAFILMLMYSPNYIMWYLQFVFILTVIARYAKRKGGIERIGLSIVGTAGGNR